MFSAPQPDPRGLAGEVLAAIQQRAWERLEGMVAADVTVEVHAAPAVRATRNEHIWRSRRLQGRDEVREYLVELRHAVPALALQPGTLDVRDGCEVVRADCAGVDSAGSPFDAVAEFAIWQREGLVTRLEADVADLTVGTDVIRNGEGDLRRYFKAFLAG